MFKKRVFLLFILLFSLFFTACTSQKEEEIAAETKIYKVGVLSGLDFFLPTFDGLKEGMEELGYTEGKNIIYDLRQSNFDPEKEKQIVQDFIDKKADLIFTFPTEASMNAKITAQNSGIPIVFANANIEDTGLVESILEPGDNITGVRYPGPDLAVKRFEITWQLFPDTKKIALPYQAGYPIVNSQLAAIKEAADPLGIEFIEIPAKDKADAESQLAALEKAGDIAFDTLMFIPEPLGANPEAYAAIVAFADRHHIPVCGGSMAVGEYAGLFSVITDNVATGKQAAYLVDKVLKGTPAGTIPVLSAESFLEINYASAKKRGFKIPEGLLNMADNIIQ